MTTIEAGTGTWRELLGPVHLRPSIVLAGGVALHAINIFLTTSLLPTAVDDIGGEHLYAWSATVFMIASVISSTLVSRVLGRRGPTVAYLAGLVPFFAGTMICALSPTMEVLLAGRAVQGVGGGLLAGLGYAVIHAALPTHLWNKATALVSAMWGVGTLAGPAIGGVFAQFDAWRFAFGLLALLSVVITVLAVRALPAGRRSDVVDPVPLAALVILTVATAMISIAGLLSERALILAGVVGAGVVFAAFVWRERVSGTRVLPRTTYVAGSALKWVYLTIAVLAMGSVTEAFTPLFGQRLAGLEPLVAGFMGAALSVGWSFTMLFSANASTPAAIRRLRLLGPAVLAAGLAVAAAVQQQDIGAAGVVVWATGLVVAGAGVGLAFPHLIVAAMTSTPDEAEASKAAAGVNTVEAIALTFGSAIGGVLLNLGAPVDERSAQYVMWGFVVIAVLGCLSAVRADRRTEVAN